MIKFNKKTDSHRSDRFEMRIDLNRWDIVKELTENQLKKIRDSINEILGLSEIESVFGISISDSETIQQFHNQNKRCESCFLKMKECFNCVLTCQSPLERDLFLALLSLGLDTKLQQRINKDGKVYDNTEPVDKANILTVPDFYIATSDKNYCIYTDGHTYHERTEYQALRDRNIDRELQLMGFIVLRYTGKEIRDELKKTALHIFNNVTKKEPDPRSNQMIDDFIFSINGKKYAKENW